MTKTLLDQYYELPDNKKVAVLSNAIDYMQQYNGRTKRECIELSMQDFGYKEQEEKTA